MTSYSTNAAASNSATNALIAQWLLSNSSSSGASLPVVEGNQIPPYLLQSNMGFVEGSNPQIESDLRALGQGDFYNPNKYIKAADATNFGVNNKPVDLYGKAFLDPVTTVNKTKSLTTNILNGTAIPINANGTIQNLSSVFNTGPDQYTQLPYINPLAHPTYTNAFSVQVFSTVLGSLLTGQPSPLTPAMLTNTLFGAADGDQYQQDFLTNRLGAQPPLTSLNAAQLNSKVLGDLGQSPLNSVVQQFLQAGGSNGGSASINAANLAALQGTASTGATTNATASSPDAATTAFMAYLAQQSAQQSIVPAAATATTALPSSSLYGGELSSSQLGIMSDTSSWLKQYQAATAATSAVPLAATPVVSAYGALPAVSTALASPSAASSASASTIASTVYGGMLSGDQVSMMTDTSQWLKQYKAATQAGASPAVAAALPSGAVLPAMATTAAALTPEAIAAQTSWIRQLQGKDDTAYTEKLKAMFAGANPDVSLTGASAATNTTPATTQAVAVQAAVQSAIQQVMAIIIPKVTQLLQALAAYTQQGSATSSDKQSSSASEPYSDDTNAQYVST